MIVKNFSSGVLATAIGTGDTSITLNAGHTLPTSGTFTGIIWNSLSYASPSIDPLAEIVLGVYSSTNVYTITRAQENTSAVAHGIGATIGLYITAGVIYGVPFSNQQVVTGSRTIGTSYQNTTSKAMLVVVSIANTSGGVVDIIAYSDSTATPTTEVATASAALTSGIACLSFMVLPGNYYKVSNGSSISCWTEVY